MRRKFGVQFSTFNFVVMATGSVSISNLSAFEVIGSKAREIAGDVIAAAETRNVARGNTVVLSPKLRHQSSVMPYSTNSRRTSYLVKQLLNLLAPNY